MYQNFINSNINLIKDHQKRELLHILPSLAEANSHRIHLGMHLDFAQRWEEAA